MRAPDVRRALLAMTLGGLLGAALVHPPSARADSADFLRDMDRMGFYHDLGDAHLLDFGYDVCRAIDAGATGTMVADSIFINTGWDISYQDAANFVISAVENLCPEFDNRPKPSGTLA